MNWLRSWIVNNDQVDTTRAPRYSSVQIEVNHTAASDAIKQGVEKLDPPHSHERKDFFRKLIYCEEIPDPRRGAQQRRRRVHVHQE